MKLQWTAQALEDLKSLYDYIVEENPAAARAIISRIRAMANHLKQHPQMGKVGRLSGTRELVIVGTPFIVVYTVKSSDIAIVAVIHTAQRWPDSF